MKLPIDVVSLITDAIDIEQSRSVPVSVNILVDESASPEFQVFVRAGFNSDSPNSRVMVSYFPTQEPDASIACDVAVIAAGTAPRVGALARQLREAGTPTLVVAESGAVVASLAEREGAPLPEQDVVALPEGSGFDEEARTLLADKVGEWIVASCPDKRLAFSIAYPFVRRPLAYEAIRTTSIQNAGVGVVVFVPGADMPIMTANQAKMVLQIAAAYGQPLGPDRVKELAGVLVNALVFRGISRQIAGAVPAIGWAVKGGMGYAGTQAIGRAAIEYFEQGGNVAGLAAVVGKATAAATGAVEAVRSVPSVDAAVGLVGPQVRRAATTLLDVASPVARSAAKTAFSALRPGARKGQRR